MTLKDFNAMMATRWFDPESRTFKALRLVLVSGHSVRAAAHKHKLNTSTVAIALNTITVRGTCPHCQQSVRTIKPWSA